MRFKFFHTPKPRSFEYIPRFYDPEKEEWEARKREVMGDNYPEKEGEEYQPGQYVKEIRIRRGIIADRERASRKQRKTLRSIIFLILLIAVGWWLISTDSIANIWEIFLQSGKK